MSSERIDLVYLWVDGADPVWQAKRQAAQVGADLARYGNVAGRYRDNGELRFNLRAIERFFPQHGQIFIISDGQRPAWLADHAAVTFIDHHTLIPAQARPVFDAGHIESYLHHIPALSERFIYLNDDIFFAAPVEISDWFPAQGVAVHFETQRIPAASQLQQHETALINAAIFSRSWLVQHCPDAAAVPYILAHSPRAFLKSALWELEERAPELFAAVRSTQFRSWRVPPIMSDLVLRWLICQGKASAHLNDVLHISSCADDAGAQLARLQQEFGQRAFFCINDTCDDCDNDDPRLQHVSQTLAQLLPQPSCFEA